MKYLKSLLLFLLILSGCADRPYGYYLGKEKLSMTSPTSNIFSLPATKENQITELEIVMPLFHPRDYQITYTRLGEREKYLEPKVFPNGNDSYRVVFKEPLSAGGTLLITSSNQTRAAYIGNKRESLLQSCAQQKIATRDKIIWVTVYNQAHPEEPLLQRLAELEIEYESEQYHHHKTLINPDQKRQALNSYLKNYPRGHYRLEASMELAKLDRNKEDDQLAEILSLRISTTKIERLEEMLKTSSGWNYAQIEDNIHIAKEELDDTAFHTVASLEGWRKKIGLMRYLESFPMGKYRSKAQELMVLIDQELELPSLETALKVRNLKNRYRELKTHLEYFPTGNHLEQATTALNTIQRQVEKEAYQQALRKSIRNRKPALEAFIADYPDSLHINEAHQALRETIASLDERTYQLALQKKSENQKRKELERYLLSYPEGRYRAMARTSLIEANHNLEKSIFEEAIGEETLSERRRGLLFYLDIYPYGTYSNQAMKLLKNSP